MTARWAQRCVDAHTRPDQSLFWDCAGRFLPRASSALCASDTSVGFDGYALGGLSVGEGHVIMNEVLDATLPHMPQSTLAI